MLEPNPKEYKPDSHVVHDVAPTLEDQEPGLHGMHSASPAEDQVPGTQSTHMFDDAALTEENVPAIQLMQTEEIEAPLKADHVPSLHSMHEVDESAPSMEDQVPALQLIQVEESVAPASEDHVPGIQSLHPTLVDSPATEDQVPAAQS